MKLCLQIYISGFAFVVVKILYIQTAIQPYFVGVTVGNNFSEQRQTMQMQDAQQFIHTAIQDMMSALDMTVRDLDAICVNTGPGSYTSLRLGLAATIGIGWFTNKPVIAFSSLQLMGFNCLNPYKTGDKWLGVVHARKEECYMAWLEHPEPTRQKEAEVFVGTQGFLSEQTHVKIIALQQEKGTLPLDHQQNNIVFTTIDLPSMAGLARLYYAERLFVDLHTLEPLYVRNPYL